MLYLKSLSHEIGTKGLNIEQPRRFETGSIGAQQCYCQPRRGELFSLEMVKAALLLVTWFLKEQVGSDYLAVMGRGR